MILRFLTSLCLILLSGCIAQPNFVGVGPDAPGTVHEVYVVSNRTPAQPPFVWGTGRGSELSFGLVEVVVPPDHKPGRLERPDGKADQDFAVRRGWDIDQSDFIKGMRTDRKDGAILYVHGFNNGPAEATYRIAQLVHDFGAEGPVAAFLWPSEGSLLGYVHDRDSALQSRDALEEVIADLAGPNLVVVGHSMGALLLVETLRQMKLAGREPVLQSVVLISPDIDPDLFDTQLDALGPRAGQINVFINRRDRVLSLSSFIAREGERVGNAADVARLRSKGVNVFDLSNLNGPQDHLAIGETPESIDFVRRLITAGRQAGPDPV